DIIRHSRVRLIFGAGEIRRLGSLVVDEGGTRALLVTDPGIIRAGHVDRAANSMREAGVEVTVFSGVEENPTTHHVEAGVSVARDLGINFIVGLGGGSSMDAAKGINFALTNGGRMQDYWGIGKATKPMLPFIAIPTTAGTGSEAQSFALITDPDSHQKMACGDEKALAKIAILDPDLIATVPRKVAAATGIDAVAHAVETAGTKKRSDLSRQFSREAWTRLDRSFDAAMQNLSDARVREDMLLGAHLAGVAIEKSMLGAAHSCANPLTSEFGVVHGMAVGLMLPHVIRFNCADGQNPYSDLCDDPAKLAARIESMLLCANLPRRLDDLHISAADAPRLAALAANQWTAQFNPRAISVESFEQLYRSAV
ncbi:MAG TPA: iron-containing alcohol dehydrogenase, partial [Phycisphaerae bacterium]|nr:iron-containing alcohol dehydrogenase [Phycisphaerae bacterium]